MSPRRPAAAPPVRVLEDHPVHVVVRDWPETLAPLRRLGCDPRQRGGQPLATVLREKPELAAALERALAWRGAGS